MSEAEAGAPPGEAAAIPAGRSRETKLRRDPWGRWFDGDQAIDQPAIEGAFDAWIDRAEDGRYILKNSVNWAYVHVDGAPVSVRHVRFEPDGVWLSLSDARLEQLAPDTLRTGPDGQLYCTVRFGRLPARFEAAALVELSEHLEESDDGACLRLGARRCVIPEALEPLA